MEEEKLVHIVKKKDNVTRVPLSCPACCLEVNYFFTSDLPSICLLYLLPPSFPSSCHRCHSANCTYQSSSSLHAVNFVTLSLFFSPLPLSPASPSPLRRYLAFILRFKAACPSHPSVRLMFDNGPLKCADFRGCLADGLVGLQRVQAGGLPSELDQLLPRHCYPLFFPVPSSLALPRALGMRRSGEGWTARKVQVSLRARACGLDLFFGFVADFLR